MAVLATVSGKAKERVRIHAQLGDFPLLTDARVVRMTKHRGGFRWAMKFEQMDQRMRSNLEAFVRQQLANDARVRQAQLYAQRLKGGAMPPIPTGPLAAVEPALPTPDPQQLSAPHQALPTDPSVPLYRPDDAAPGANPVELDVPPAQAAEPPRVLEIELPPMEPSETPPLDRSSASPPDAQEVYVPYQASDTEDEAAMLGEGPGTPAPGSHAPVQPDPPAVTAAPDPSKVAPRSKGSMARTFTPGIIEIADNEDLSLEDILSEVEGGDAPVSDLELPPLRELKADSSGLGDVPVVDAEMGDEEETRRRDSAIPDQPASEALKAQVAAGVELPTDSALRGNTILADAAPGPLPGSEVDATVPLEGALPDVPSGKSTLIAGSQAYVPARSNDIGGLPFSADEPAEEDSDEIALDSLEPSFGGTPPPEVQLPIYASEEDAAVLVPSLGDVPALGEPAPTLDPPPSMVDGPRLDEAPPLDDALALVGASVDLDDASAPADTPLDDAPSLAGAPGFGAALFLNDAPPFHDDEAGLDAADLAEVAAPWTATPIPGSVSSEVPSLDSALIRTAPTPPPGSVDASFLASPSPFYDGPDTEPACEELEPDIPEPFANLEPQSAVPTPMGEAEPPVESAEQQAAGPVGEDEEDEHEDPQPPAFLDEGPPRSSGPSSAPLPTPTGTPIPSGGSLYSDDAQPFDPYAPNPPSNAGAALPRIGSAPRALGELPPVVAGLYTPTSNPAINEDSGAYAAATFEPFSSTEEGLYGDRSDVTFEEQQGNPRQRLAFLQHDDTRGVPEHHEHFLGDIEGVTSGLTPTDYKRNMTDEDLDPEVPAESAEPAEFQADLEGDLLDGDASTSVEAVPDLIEVEPTHPVDVGPVEFTPPPTDEASLRAADAGVHTPEPEELSIDDVEFEELDAPEPEPEPEKPNRGLATYPEFNVIPDFDQAPQSESKPAGPPPAQSGKTMVQSLESLGMMRPPDDSPMPVPTSSPADFAPVASFGGPQAPLAGFTVVAEFDDGGDDKPGSFSGSTMIATAEDVEAWKLAGLAAKDDEKPVFDEDRTITYTPAPGSLESIESSPSFGASPLNEDDLTAMRVGRGGPAPSGGAGFQLNPRGPAPESQGVANPVARVPLAKIAVPARPSATVPAPPNRSGDTVPVPSRPPAQPLPSARPTLPPGNPQLPARDFARPGASSRRGTALESGGRPAPPPKPAPSRAAPQHAPRIVPELQGSGSMATPPSKKSLVEDALAQLKRKTEEKRKSRGEPEAKEEAKPIAKPQREVKRTRKRRSFGAAELTDPAIAELYKAAMTDLDGSRD